MLSKVELLPEGPKRAIEWSAGFVNSGNITGKRNRRLFSTPAKESFLRIVRFFFFPFQNNGLSRFLQDPFQRLPSVSPKDEKTVLSGLI